MMRRLLKRIRRVGRFLGLDPSQLATTVRELPGYWRDLREFRRQMGDSDGEFPIARLDPCFGDRFAGSGQARGHYFHQDLLVARWIFEDQPIKHVDVGSRVDGFVAHVASFREIEVLDIRPQAASIHPIQFVQADLSVDQPQWRQYSDSVSCLHSLEHFGLGRYGDRVDYEGHLKGWANLHGLLKPGGRLYFSVPIGPQRVEFNGQRVFSMTYLRSIITPLYDIERFAYVNDAGDLILDADAHEPAAANNFGCDWGCGVFSLIERRK